MGVARGAMKDERVMTDVERAATPPQDVRPGARVIGVDGELGQVSRVVVGPDGDQVVGLIVRESHPLRRQISIPIALVEGADSELVRLSLAVDDLDEYRDDDQLTDAVLDILWYRSDLTEDELRYLKVQTTDGIVDLSGYTGTERARAAVEAVARRVRGVLGVRDRARSLEALGDAARTFERLRAPDQRKVDSE